MTVKASGSSLAISEINTEFARGTNLNAYRGTSWYTGAGGSGTFSAGAISMSEAYSKRVTFPGNDSYAKLLVHGNSTLVDNSASAKSITNTSVSISSSASKFGGASCFFNGTAYYTVTADADLTFGTGDFTIDFWIYATDVTAGDPFEVGSYDNYDGVFLQLVSGNLWTYVNRSGGQSMALSANTWTHVAIVRSGGTLYGFKNGALQWSVANSANVIPTAPLQVGLANNMYQQYFNGYMDELRVSKGIARWTSAFTAPSAQYS